MKILLCLFAVIATLIPKNALGPWDLTSPREWTNSPVSLSKCHPNELVHLTLKFTCPVKTSKDRVVYIKVFGEIYKGVSSDNTDKESGETLSVEVKKVLTPNEPGVYVLGVYLKSGEKGQTLAQNYRYTTVGVCEPKSGSEELGVELVGLEKWGKSFGVDLEFIAHEGVQTGYIMLVSIGGLFEVNGSTEYSLSSNSTTELEFEGFMEVENKEIGFVFGNGIGNGSLEGPIRFYVRIRNVLTSGYSIASSIDVQVDVRVLGC